MQMSTLMSTHIVRLARINKEVGLCASCNTSLEECEAMLWHNSSIVVTGNYLQSALKILCLIEQRGLLVTLGVGLRSIHIALTIHHLIPMPVDNRTTSYANLEYVGIVGHK